MKILALNQPVKFLNRNKIVEGEIVEYERNGQNSRYKIKTIYKTYWKRRKDIIDTSQRVQTKPVAIEYQPVSFTISFD